MSDRERCAARDPAMTPYGPGTVLGPTRTYAQLAGGDRQGSAAVPPSEGGVSRDLFLLEGLDGPTPQDAVTPEIQRNLQKSLS